MLRIIGVLVLVVSSVTAQFTPTISVTCSPESTTVVEFVVTISGLTDNSGSVYIEDYCATQTTSTGSATYTFGDTDCTSDIAMDVAVPLIVRENALFSQLTDKRVTITCSVSDDKTITTDFTASISETETTDDISYEPDMTIEFENTDGTITGATLGDSVSLSIVVDNYATNGIDFQLTTLSAATAGGTPVTVVSSGCSDYDSIVGDPVASTSGDFGLTFSLFAPFDSITSSATEVVTFSATVTFCDGSCVQTTCAKKRRRRDVSNNATSNTANIATAIVVYPPGSKLAKSIRGSDLVVLDEVCLSRTPLIGMIIGMAIALAMCMGISAWMFCRMRRPSGKGPEAGFTNTSYQ